jgi:hypothetical protein
LKSLVEVSSIGVPKIFSLYFLTTLLGLNGFAVIQADFQADETKLD